MGVRATSLVEGSVDQTIKELRDQVIELPPPPYGHLPQIRQPNLCITSKVLLSYLGEAGWGSFAPSIDLEGNLAISFRPDTAFANGLNVPGVFTGTIINRENIGKTTDELVTRWNTDNPEDQVSFSAS